MSQVMAAAVIHQRLLRRRHLHPAEMQTLQLLRQARTPMRQPQNLKAVAIGALTGA
jgi:hypothetical protein